MVLYTIFKHESTNCFQLNFPLINAHTSFQVYVIKYKYLT